MEFLAFLLFEEFLAFFEYLSFFSKNLRGSEETENPVVVFLFAKEQGKEDQGGVPGGAKGPGGCLRRIGELGGGGGGLFFCSGPKRPRSVSNGVSGGGSQALEREDLGPWWSGGVRANPSFTSELWLAKRTSQSPWPKHKAPSHQFRGMSNASSRTRS